MSKRKSERGLYVLSMVLIGGIATALLPLILPLIPVMSQPPRLQPRSIAAASAVTMVWLALVASRGPALQLIQAVGVAVLMVLSATYDIPSRIIPNRLVLASTIVYVAMLAVTSPQYLTGALTGGLITAGAMLVLQLVSRGGFGAGDAKLIAATGVMLGPKAALMICGLAFVISGIPALFYVITGRRGHKFAFGPYIAAAGLLVSLSGTYL